MNPMDIIKNLQNVQSKMGEVQEKMKAVTVTGSSGGEMVKIEMAGDMTIRNVTIAPEAVDPGDIGMLEDLILAAFTDALANVRDAMQQEMSSITGGLNLPPGLFGM